MDLTSDFVSFITRYARTALDLVLFLRPKRFVEAARTQPDRYLEPLPFLVVSLVLSTFVGFTFASMLLEGEELATLERIGIAGAAVGIGVIWLINLFLVFAGTAAARLLHLNLTLQQSFDAYCYSSVFFPFFVAANQTAFFTYTEPHIVPVMFASLVQILFVVFLMTMMASIAQVNRPKSVVFIVATPLVLFGTGALLGWGIGMSERSSASEDARTAFQPVDFFIGSCDRAILRGHVQPDEVEMAAWFEWGETPDLGHVTTKQRITNDTNFSYPLPDVKENTTYYYRAMASGKTGLLTGRLLSFTTPRC